MKYLALLAFVAAIIPTDAQVPVSLLHFGTVQGTNATVGDCLSILSITSSGVTATDSGVPGCGGSSGGTVTSVSVTGANGFAGTVATATTTPAITITTSISGVLKGNASALAAATSSDLITLFTGTCSSATFLRGDGACATPGVTSVALADNSTTPIYTIGGTPITSTGTLTETLNTQSANTVFAGPTTGTAAQPAFRALVVADVPTGLNQNTTGTAGGLSGTPAISVGALTAAGTTSINASNNATTAIGTGTTTSGVTFCNALNTCAFDGPVSFALGTTYSGSSWTTAGVQLSVAASTLNDSTASGTVTTEAANAFGAPTISATTSGVTITNLANLYLATPVAGTHVTATNLWSLFTAGSVDVGGQLQVNSALASTFTGAVTTTKVGLTAGAACAGSNANVTNTTGTVVGVCSGSTQDALFSSTLNTMSQPTITGATAFTVSGCGTASSITGNGTVGTFVVGTGAATCTFVITANGATGMTAPHGWHADVDDETAKIHCTNTTTVSTTTANVICNSTVATSDVIAVAIFPY